MQPSMCTCDTSTSSRAPCTAATRVTIRSASRSASPRSPSSTRWSATLSAGAGGGGGRRRLWRRRVGRLDDDRAIVDARVLPVGVEQRREAVAADAHHRKGAAEELVADNRAERNDIVRIAQHDRRRRALREQQLEDHLAARAGAAAARQHQHAVGDRRVVQRVAAVDHGAGRRVDAAPEGEADACGEEAAARAAGHERARAQHVRRRRAVMRAAVKSEV